MRYVSLFLLLLVFSAPSYAQDIDDSDLVIQNAYDILKQIDEESADDLPPPVKKSTPTTTKAPVRTITAEKIPPFSGPKEYSLSFENPDSPLSESHEKVLIEDIFFNLKSDATLRLEIRAFSNVLSEQQSQARRASLQRAIQIRDYLMEKGLDERRFFIRPLGHNDKSDKERVELLLKRI